MDFNWRSDWFPVITISPCSIKLSSSSAFVAATTTLPEVLKTSWEPQISFALSVSTILRKEVFVDAIVLLSSASIYLFVISDRVTMMLYNNT
ncbi:MAG: hypothetical protein BWY74_04485 [Firmicutes bacterium ADurb.Bin419]|nr:MAG: hypothetical protein BWY74_04485 [Firmicutes bacterium ADurb.Bin419]